MLMGGLRFLFLDWRGLIFSLGMFLRCIYDSKSVAFLDGGLNFLINFLLYFPNLFREIFLVLLCNLILQPLANLIDFHVCLLLLLYFLLFIIDNLLHNSRKLLIENDSDSTLYLCLDVVKDVFLHLHK